MNNSSYLVAAILGVLAFILTVNVGFAQVSYRTDLVGEAEVPPFSANLLVALSLLVTIVVSNIK